MDTIPAIVRILFIFALVLLAMRQKWSLGNALIAGTIGLGLLFGMGPWAIARSAVWSLIHPKTLSLTIVVALILIFSHSLEQSGQMARLLERFKGLIRNPKLNLVVFPALIGLLPMPGGAIFSAPMVKSLGRDHALSPSLLSYINYWFRHIWEYWWPLYPGILLTTALAGMNLWRLVLVTAPITVVAILAGYWPLRGWTVANRSDAPRTALRPFLRELAPIAGVIGLGLAGGVLLSALLPSGLQSVAKELGLITALLIAIAWVWRINTMTWPVRWQILKSHALLKMIYMIAAILIFKGILEDSQAVDRVSGEMLRWQIPLVPITVVLPFLVGLVVGITIAFVGTTFPILISLIQAMGQQQHMPAYLMLALASGFIGVLASPLHLCFLMSNQYFETSLIPVYRHMRMPLAAILIAALGYFGLLRYLLR
ncbi:MAG: DUF401 family protein [Desulfatitalea sp.]|nr:DUF401 family protein [Desulfatitalea sp.]